MSYQGFEKMDLYNIIIRWHQGYKIRQISRALNLDRKTVRKYIKLAQKAGLSLDQALPEKTVLLALLQPLLKKNHRSQPKRTVFEPYREEIKGYLTHPSEPLKPKTVFEVLCQKYRIDSSYSSFKRFMREQALDLHGQSVTTCRFETEPGEEIEIDYGKMGRLFDPDVGKNRDVFAFIATLAYSVPVVFRNSNSRDSELFPLIIISFFSKSICNPGMHRRVSFPRNHVTNHVTSDNVIVNPNTIQFGMSLSLKKYNIY